MAVSAFVIAIGAILFIAAVSFVIGHLEVVRLSRAQRLIDAGSPFVDVDPPEVFAVDHPRGAINVPLDDLDTLASQLDPSKPIVVYGHHTLAAAMASRQLEKRGFRVVDLGPARPEGWLTGQSLE